MNEEKQAFEEMKASAEQGDEESQFDLAVMYENGKGTKQDYKKALYWYQKSAEQGMADAQYSLGIMRQLSKGKSS